MMLSSGFPFSYILFSFKEKPKACSSFNSVPHSGSSLLTSLNKCFHVLIVNPPNIYCFLVLINVKFGPIKSHLK